jgi:hypothetical protein
MTAPGQASENRDETTPPIPVSSVVIARSEATRQSSRNHRATPASPRHPFCHCEEPSDAAIQRPFGQPPCFCVVIARSEATRQSSRNHRATPASPRQPLLSLRGAQRRGNPFCHCEERSDAAIQRPFGQPPCFCVVIARSEATRQSSRNHRATPASPGIPHHRPASRITPQTGLPRQFSSRPSSQ